MNIKTKARVVTAVVGSLFAAIASARSIRVDNPNTSGGTQNPQTPLQWGCLTQNWQLNVYPVYGNLGPYPYPSTIFNPGGLPTALVPGTDSGSYTVLGCEPGPTWDFSYNPPDSSSIFLTGTNESFATTLDPNYLATGGELYFFVADPSGTNPFADENPTADVVVWTLANGDIEIELDNWCTSGAAGASFSWAGIAYTGGCTSPTNDFLFDGSGNLIGYVNDSATSPATFTGTLSSGSPTVTGVTIPAGLTVGAWINDSSDQSLIPPGTTVIAIGTNTITMSANALGASSPADGITYTPWTLNVGTAPLTSPPSGWQTTVLAPPTGLSSTSTSGGAITLTWTPAAGATSYNIWAGPSTAALDLIFSGVTSSTATLTKQPPGTALYFQVDAVYPNGLVSGPSQQIVGTALPVAPTGLTADLAGSTSIALQWTAGAGASTYSIFEGATSGAEASTPIASGITITSYTLTGLSPGETYYFDIVAVDAGGKSAVSNQATIIMPPSAPKGVAAMSGNGAVTLNWTGSIGATSYRIYEGSSSGEEGASPIASGVTQASYTVSKLNPGQTYFFYIKASNAGGNSTTSDEATATVLAAPPTGLTATAANGAVTLSWMASTGATGYKIYEGLSAGAESGTPTASSTGTSATIPGLTNGQAYFFKVAASDAGGISATSAETSATPMAPTGRGGGGAMNPMDLFLGSVLILVEWRRRRRGMRVASGACPEG
jgi:fibronectin type 3 domain-containing protein